MMDDHGGDGDGDGDGDVVPSLDSGEKGRGRPTVILRCVMQELEEIEVRKRLDFKALHSMRQPAKSTQIICTCFLMLLDDGSAADACYSWKAFRKWIGVFSNPLHDIRFKRVCREAHVWVSEATAIKVIKRLESFGDPDASISDRHNVVRILFRFCCAICTLVITEASVSSSSSTLNEKKN